jgi:hypothetical protein
MFLDKTNSQSKEEVSAIVGETLFSTTTSTDATKAVRRFIAKFSNNTPTIAKDIEDVLRYLCHSIVICHLNLMKKEDIGTGEGRFHPVWNIYILPPTVNLVALFEWHTIICEVIFVMTDNSVGRMCKLFKCMVCQSEDYPTSMCPYPSQPGCVRTTQRVTQSMLVLRACLERKNRDCLHTLEEEDGERGECG